ncbi:MAG: aminotransferase class III-fold pyridoxal phosphate-dependent enzyme, partial [Deltaproteobacteria bacterium]|nr:aminotransferase class III-fold pyridoxal phosphate-dependent enzyme [Deltaproteobacteria bacterium]
LLLSTPWKKRITTIEQQLQRDLAPARTSSQVQDVRVLGAIGVIEMTGPVNLPVIQQRFVERGVWIRPFGKLVYVMPPYIITPRDLSVLTTAICEVVKNEEVLTKA